MLAKGEELSLPNFGLETVHHVHADDVAQLFMSAIAHWSASVGEAFHAVSPAAITLRGYAEAMAAWFGREPKLRFLPWQKWKDRQNELEAEQTYDHIAHSPNCSIAKAQRMLGYRPRYRSIESVCESVSWLIERGIVQVESKAV
jgi:nucleoside-diphosphate-sugar epimerase